MKILKLLFFKCKNHAGSCIGTVRIHVSSNPQPGSPFGNFTIKTTDNNLISPTQRSLPRPLPQPNPPPNPSRLPKLQRKPNLLPLPPRISKLPQNVLNLPLTEARRGGERIVGPGVHAGIGEEAEGGVAAEAFFGEVRGRGRRRVGRRCGRCGCGRLRCFVAAETVSEISQGGREGRRGRGGILLSFNHWAHCLRCLTSLKQSRPLALLSKPDGEKTTQGRHGPFPEFEQSIPETPAFRLQTRTAPGSQHLDTTAHAGVGDGGSWIDHGLGLYGRAVNGAEGRAEEPARPAMLVRGGDARGCGGRE